MEERAIVFEAATMVHGSAFMTMPPDPLTWKIKTLENARIVEVIAVFSAHFLTS
jgi:hypothetical protein